MSQRWQGNQTNADSLLLPASHVTFDDANEIIHYLAQTSNLTATIEFDRMQFGDQPTPVVSFTSGRGPNFFSRNIIKPDVVAPGSNTLAAWPIEVGPNRTGKNKTFNKEIAFWIPHSPRIVSSSKIPGGDNGIGYGGGEAAGIMILAENRVVEMALESGSGGGYGAGKGSRGGFAP
ncbi:uncharacterized protein A4U43_C10F3980 [Asparagus officinalis]|uniref:Uncharacterized protein n=1 Tax=Asparagus officinalis TaxID=4686 RepID=A0A5P1E3R5_ASPOF|nr:uncharacterized protein A4U43_C10F3980 [Asparagus officinalis]